jgi:hypothetical protein
LSIAVLSSSTATVAAVAVETIAVWKIGNTSRENSTKEIRIFSIGIIVVKRFDNDSKVRLRLKSPVGAPTEMF